MKDSGVEWIGEMPEDWKVLAAKYHINIFNGSDPKEDGDIPVYGSGDIIFKYSKEYKVGPAVLLGRKGTIENPKYVEGKYWNVDTVFDVKSNKALSLKFYFYLSMVFDYKKYITSTALPSMTKENYENIRIPYPEKIEQKQIVERLDKETEQIKNIKSAIKDEIQTLEAYKKSVITEAVTKGLDKDAEMKDSGIEWIGEIPKHWKVIQLRNLANIVRGGSPRPINEYMSNNEQDFNWIKIGDADKNSKYINKTKNKLKASGLSSTTVVRKGDLILSNSMSYGEAYILNIDGCIHDGWLAFKMIKGVNQEYLYFALLSFNTIIQFDKLSDGGVVQNLNIDKVKSVKIFLPSIKEQEEIVSYLDKKTQTIDEVIAIKQNQLSVLDEYKKSLIYEYVTGKREV